MKLFSLLIMAVSMAAGAAVVPPSVKFNSSGIQVEFTAKSGQTMVTRIASPDLQVYLYIEKLTEVDENKTAITGDPNRSVELVNTTYVPTREREDKYFENNGQNISVTEAIFTADPISSNNSAAVRVVVRIFNQDANVTMGQERTEIMDGEVHVEATITNWKFANPKNSLQVKVSAAGATAPVIATNPRTDGYFLDVGEGSSLILSRQVKVGNDYRPMANDSISVQSNTLTINLVSGTPIAYNAFLSVGVRTPTTTTEPTLAASGLTGSAILLALVMLSHYFV